MAAIANASGLLLTTIERKLNLMGVMRGLHYDKLDAWVHRPLDKYGDEIKISLDICGVQYILVKELDQLKQSSSNITDYLIEIANWAASEIDHLVRHDPNNRSMTPKQQEDSFFYTSGALGG